MEGEFLETPEIVFETAEKAPSGAFSSSSAKHSLQELYTFWIFFQKISKGLAERVPARSSLASGLPQKEFLSFLVVVWVKSGGNATIVNMKKIVIGNWKMNPATLLEARKIFSKVKKTASSCKKVHTVICPPFLYLSDLASKSSKESLALGAQDTSSLESVGSYTGFLSPLMVKNIGAQYVIIGHSERRREGETDEMINKKILASLSIGLKVIFCVGEKERGHDGHFLEFVKQQIHLGLQGVSKKSLQNVLIAYEPVWAIGAENAILPRDLHQMKIYIRKVLSEFFGPSAVVKVPVIYGGTVNPENVELLLLAGEVDGFLVGRASLNPKDFSAILEVANASK
ncbi:MAG: triose-phosphate isomerase [Candidatus Pacebacteria bacterium]|nr:triose-phosphate isomerase [Candidatus Paceibacterota bacterium]